MIQSGKLASRHVTETMCLGNMGNIIKIKRDNVIKLDDLIKGDLEMIMMDRRRREGGKRIN